MPQGPDPVHGDVDLLVSNYTLCSRVLGALPKLKLDVMLNFGGNRVQNSFWVGGNELQIDIRWLGDNYMDSKWESDMLRDRILYKDHFWIPSPEHTFFGLLYHALVQKPKIEDDYVSKLVDKANQIKDSFGDCQGQLLNQTSCVRPASFGALRTLEEQRDFLCNYMKIKGYRPVPSTDKSVRYNKWIKRCGL